MIQQREAVRNVGKKSGSIHCTKCSRDLGKLEWLRRRNTTYFINEPKFLEENDCTIDKAPKSYQENVTIGNVNCICGNSLGGCQKFSDRSDLGTLCALKCKSIKFKLDGQQNFIPIAQWSKNTLFDVEEIEEL